MTVAVLARWRRLRARPHALFGGVALSVVALWILLALLLPAPANAAVAPAVRAPARAQADLLPAGHAALPALSAPGRTEHWACACVIAGPARTRMGTRGSTSAL